MNAKKAGEGRGSLVGESIANARVVPEHILRKSRVALKAGQICIEYKLSEGDACSAPDMTKYEYFMQIGGIRTRFGYCLE